MVSNSENKRFLKLRQHFDKNQIDWGKELGIKQGTVSDIERNRPGAHVSRHVKTILYIKFNVSKKWFEEGVGEMFNPKKDEDSVQSDKDDKWKDKYLNLLERHNKLLEKFKNLE